MSNPTSRPHSATPIVSIASADWLSQPPADFTELFDTHFGSSEHWPVLFGYGAAARAMETPAHLAGGLDDTPTGLERCTICGRHMPPDMTFCVHDGGAAAYQTPPFIYSVEISGFVDPSQRDGVTRLLDHAGAEADRDDIRRALTNLPVAFSVETRAWHARVLETNLRRLGLHVSVSRSTATGANAVVRNATSRITPGVVLSLVGGVGLAIWAAWSSRPSVSVVGLIVAAAGIMAFSRRAERRFRLDREALLHLSAGLNTAVLNAARSLLSQFESAIVRKRIAVLLLEYHLIASHWANRAPTAAPLRRAVDTRFERGLVRLVSVLESPAGAALRTEQAAHEDPGLEPQRRSWIPVLDDVALAANTLRRRVSMLLDAGASLDGLEGDLRAWEQAIERVESHRPGDA